ncbi:FMN-binding negative transcriptional regulator [Qipengyuania nanhaisediminis]|uniref:Negative transcriptional regulator, PaiB family n=1 Tax=Qipengyuania nanhaisediminis TaxID=604088 RepID=A0A1I5NJD5_9SPHN|nr:FMN-binding negative transcriptional regulator [Qipengyuania nanhaisediminis]SFP21894.1 negative transcriptional regulator, PaiB family [Qipengyuania nanhaisediminis]
MHPNPLFRTDDRKLIESIVAEAGFGMVFLTTPDGPRVAHVPLIASGDGALQFHIARSNALAAHLDGAKALIVVNGPHGYVSPRWYADRASVPTWDYVAIELEGAVTRLDDEGLEALLHTSITQFEDGLSGEPWQASETPDSHWAKLFKGIVGFEFALETKRPTLKLSQKQPAPVRERIAEEHAAHGNPHLARWMRKVPA